MKKKICLILVLTLVLSVFVGCSNSDKPTLNVLNYGIYMDPSLVTQFEKENNVKIIYDEYAAPEDMYTRVKAGGTDYDVIITGEYMIERMVNEDMLAELDFNNIPNFKYVGEEYKNQPYDNENKYAVPYFWGTLGILYNKETVDVSSNSWNILWDEKYKDQIVMMDSQRDTFAVALKLLGYSLNTTDINKLDEAKRLLIDQKPLVMAYVVDRAGQMISSGEAELGLVWSGEATVAMLDDSERDLGFIIPKEGSNIWIDAMCIPKTSNQKELAEKFINFITSKDATLKDINEVMYSTVHTEAIKELPDELKNNNAYNVPSDEVKNLEMFRDLKDDIKLYNTRWTEVFGK
ncbi:spermidine/putrescine ABC transporter substrate-binding protein [Sedimentibacter sp. zth1]|uniref:ABC transporter substrate-binding protein n=1 Tax=Sedimentibacter sp. zth1 TaxID=2816908 RepID=UPI001A929770|nr:spermidine/putrescine ABC transporter substrate-binding protein [Sedimentibacter sp. zth1]QSX07059.1 spermidine/putrescine ABC transporter substrate-binding protein [Sedimentibacter sp. zth1]